MMRTATIEISLNNCLNIIDETRSLELNIFEFFKIRDGKPLGLTEWYDYVISEVPNTSMSLIVTTWYLITDKLKRLLYLEFGYDVSFLDMESFESVTRNSAYINYKGNQ